MVREFGRAFWPAAALGLVMSLSAAGARAAENPLDGTYTGTSRLIRGPAETCGRPERPEKIVMQYGQSKYLWARPGTYVPFSVSGSGGVSGRFDVGRRNSITVSGQMTGNVLEMDMGGTICTRHFVLTKT